MATPSPDYEGFRNAAVKKFPKYATQIDAFIKKRQTEELARQGVVDIGDLAKTDPGAALRLSGEGIRPAATAEEQKQKSKLTDLSSSLDLLEENYKETEAKGPISGRGAGLISSITGGSVFPEVGGYEALRKSLIGPAARAISGEVGVLTDRDIARAEALLPKLGDDPKLAAQKFANVRKLIAGKGGPTAPDSAKVVSEKGQLPGIIDFLLGGAVRTAQDLGAGITANISEPQRNQASSQAFQLADSLQNQAMETTDMEKRKQLLAQANSVLGRISQQEGEVSGSFSKDIQRNYLSRGIEAGTEIATTAGIPDFLKGVLKTGGKIIRPFRTVGDMRAAAIAEASGKTISGDKVVSALEAGVKEVSPTAEAGYKKFLEIAKQKYTGKGLTIDEVVKLNTAANDAYTAAGKVGKAATAKFNKVLGDILKKELKLTAPAVSSANKLFELLYKGQKITKSVGPPALIGGAASYGGYRLIRSLMGGQ